MNLGYKVNDYSGASLSQAKPDSKTKKKTAYPSITLRGDAAKAFCKACKAGDTLQGEVKVRIVRLTDGVKGRQEYSGSDDDSSRVELELEMLDLPGVSEGKGKKDDDDESAEAAVEKYRTNKANKSDDDEEMM